MKITSENYYHGIENTKSGENLRYKNLTFLVTKSNSNTNFKLKPNPFTYFLTLITLVCVTMFFASVFLISNNENLVSLGMIPSLAIMYFSRKISTFFTEKLYEKQISEFADILRLYKQKNS